MRRGQSPKVHTVLVWVATAFLAISTLLPILGIPPPVGLAGGVQNQGDPTACDAVGNNWTNCQDALSSNNIYAYANDTAGGGSGPDSAFKDGVSVSVPTAIAAIDSIATTLPAGDNLLIAAIQLQNSAATDRTIVAGNLQLKRGATILSQSELQYVARPSTTDFVASNYGHFATLIANDTGAPANPTYELHAAANATGVNAEVKFLVVNGAPDSSFGDGASVTLSAAVDNTLISHATTLAAGDNVIIAVVQSACPPLTCGGFKTNALQVKRGATILAASQYVSEAIDAGGFYILIARDAAAPASPTYDVIINPNKAGSDAEAKILVFNGLSSATVDTASVSVGTTRTQIGQVATTFTDGDDVILGAFAIDSTASGSNYAIGSIEINRVGDAAVSENEFLYESQVEEGNQVDDIHLVRKVTTTAANPTYEGAITAPATGDFAELKLIAIHVKDAGADPGGPGKNDTAWKNFGFALDDADTVNTVEVGVEWFRNNTAPILNVTISWDGGTTWATNQTATNKSSDDNVVEFLDFSSATAWTPSKLNDTNLRARAGTNASGARLDYVTVRVNFNAAPVISNFRLEDGGGGSQAGAQLDVDVDYFFLFNVTDDDNWTDIGNDGNVSLRLWYDGNATPELTFSEQTTGANYRIELKYVDTADPAAAALSEWSVTDGRATYNTSASSLTEILSGATVIGYEFKLALRLGSQAKQANDPTNGTAGSYNDKNSWNAEVVANDGLHTTTLQTASTGEHMEFGVFMFTSVTIGGDWTVTLGPGDTLSTNTVTVTRQSNDAFVMTIWFVTHLDSGSNTIDISNVQILAAADPNDNITVDTPFTGLGEANAVYILGSATWWFNHSTDTDQDTTSVQFSVTVPLGTLPGIYTAQLTIKVEQRPA